MKSFIEYLNEVMKKPNVIQSLFSTRARKAREVYDKRNSVGRKSKVKWQEAEEKLKRDIPAFKTGVKDISTPHTEPTNASN